MTRSRPYACLMAACALLGLLASPAFAQETNEDQPSDPDTGESTVAERTLGLLPNPYERLGINSRRLISARFWATRPAGSYRAAPSRDASTLRSTSTSRSSRAGR